MRRTPPKPYYSFGHMQVAVGLLAGFVAGCASQSASEFHEAARGERVYGMVIALRDVPERDVLASPACIRRDIACALALREKSDQYASVAVHGRNVISNILVPRSKDFRPGDILQVQVASIEDRPSTFTAMGARSNQRGADCDWMDGSASEGRGGVVCFGWSYRNLLGKGL
jgi:hypothetical protein